MLEEAAQGKLRETPEGRLFFVCLPDPLLIFLCSSTHRGTKRLPKITSSICNRTRGQPSLLFLTLESLGLVS